MKLLLGCCLVVFYCVVSGFVASAVAFFIAENIGQDKLVYGLSFVLSCSIVLGFFVNFHAKYLHRYFE